MTDGRKWWQTHEQLQSVDDDARDVNLGAFGRVGDLPLDTVDFLLRVLEDVRVFCSTGAHVKELTLQCVHAYRGSTSC